MLETDRERTVATRHAILRPEGEETIILAYRATAQIADTRRVDAARNELNAQGNSQIDMRIIEAALLAELGNEKSMNICARFKAFAMDIRTDIDIGLVCKLSSTKAVLLALLIEHEIERFR